MIPGFLVLAMGLVAIACSNLTAPATGPAAPVTYSVAYSANGSSSGTAPTAQTKAQGTSQTLAANTGSLVSTLRSFAGWNTAADGTGTDYAAGGTYSTDAALALFAKWGLPVVTTLAGSITLGWDNGTGAAAGFNYPVGVVTTLAGSLTYGSQDGMGTVAGFFSPFGLATDGTSIFVADQDNHMIRQIK